MHPVSRTFASRAEKKSHLQSNIHAQAELDAQLSSFYFRTWSIVMCIFFLYISFYGSNKQQMEHFLADLLDCADGTEYHKRKY